MSNNPKQLGQTVITLVLPEDHAMERQGSLIAKYDSGEGKQSLAYMMPFRYTTLADIARAVDSAVQALEAVKRNPPQVTVPAEPVRTPKVEPKAKPSQVKSKKKKKPSLDDFPTDDEEDMRSNLTETDAAATDTVIAEAPSPEPAQPTPQPVQQPTQTMGLKLKVGDSVTLREDALDVDGDAVDFTTGRICEIDTGSQPPRFWVESADGEYDVWVREQALVQSGTDSDDLSAFEKPLGMGVPNNEGQLTLFG